MSTPFLILGLPRSRTAWLANFLTFGNIECEHELSSLRQSPEEMMSHLTDGLPDAPPYYRGAADTYAVMWIDELMDIEPDCPVVTIRRPIEEVEISLGRVGIRGVRKGLEEANSELDRVSRMRNCLSVRYADLDSPATARALQAFVAPGEPFDVRRWQMLDGMNIQITPYRFQELARRAERMLEKQRDSVIT